MIRAARLAAVSLALLAAAPARAVETPVAGTIDPRIRTLAYDPDQVFQLKGYFGFQMMLEFAPDERIENIGLGDGLGWQVTPNKKANLLFLKPIDRTAATNMTVVTDRRRYVFELVVGADKPKPAEMAYVVRFRYPQDGPAQVVLPPPPPVAEAAHPEDWNFAYSYTGAKESAPSRVFDDGQATYFAWPETSNVPAVFVVGADGGESLANYAIRGRYLVVDQLAPRFVLRNGKAVTLVVNETLASPGKGSVALVPADPRNPTGAP